MRQRPGFTLVELLVSMALIVFVMLILTQAFTSGLETFRRLKGLGDMQERLRSAAGLLRQDLAADHFEGSRKLSDATFWSPERIREGFFRLQGGPSIAEGTDPDLAGLGTVVAPVRATDHQLHFSVKLRGNAREDYFTAALVANSPLVAVPPAVKAVVPTTYGNLPNDGRDARYQDPPGNTTGVYNSAWAEVAYFLVPNGTTASGTPLFALYRSQFVVVPDTTKLTVAAPDLAGLRQRLAEHLALSCWPDTPRLELHINTPSDLATPANRAFTRAAADRGAFDPTRAEGWAASLVATDVVSFAVRALRRDLATGQTDAYFGDLASFDSAGPKQTYVIRALQVSIRLWDLKTEQARQVTVVQDM